MRVYGLFCLPDAVEVHLNALLIDHEVIKAVLKVAC